MAAEVAGHGDAPKTKETAKAPDARENV